MERPDVAIITPCGGHHAQYVREAVESCAVAEPPPHEIVVFDDGAKPPVDESLGMGVKLLRTEQPMGRSMARNLAAAETKAPWLFFLDADDLLEPTAIAEFYGILDAIPTMDLLYGNLQRRTSPDVTRTVVTKFDRRLLAVGELGVNIGAFVRHDRFKRVGGFNVTMDYAEDREFFARYAMNPDITVVCADTAFFTARVRSVSRQPREDYAAAKLALARRMRAGEYEAWKSA